MIIPVIIFYFNVAAWLLPPFRQWDCKYFLYFLILALSDPIILIAESLGTFDSTPFYLFVSTFILIALIRKISLFLILIIDLIASIYLTFPEIKVITFLIHFVILLFFLREFIIIISTDSKIVIFYLILVLYEASVLFKFAASYMEVAGYLFYYITTAFEVFIAVFFAIYNEKNSPVIKLQLEPDRQK